jgi:hypothetical protein
MNPFATFPEDEDIAWLAGIFEGEGSFMQLKKFPGVPVMSIGMNDEDVIAKVAKLCGVDYHMTTYGPNKTKRYQFMIRGRARAGRLMGAMYPLMGERRQEQIKKALQFAPEV